MIAYFTASIVGKKYYLKNYQKIIDILKTKNYHVLSDHIIKTSEQDIHLQHKNDRIKFHRQLEDWISSCNFMIVESSFPSISVGYEISLALRFNKPVLILYSSGDPPSLFANHQDEKIICEKYSINNLKEIIDDFINYAQGRADSRFTFFITAKIAAFLQNISEKKRLPKSVYLRKLIEKEMKVFSSHA